MNQRSMSATLDRRLAAPMFLLALFVLVLNATMIHMYPVPNSEDTILVCLILIACLYPIFIIETIAHWLCGSKQLKQHLWFCLVPPLRMVGRDHDQGQTVWLPFLGWRECGRDLENFLTKLFSVPMIVIALCVIPVIAMELIWQQTIQENRTLRLIIQVAVAFIWAAFAFEFVIFIMVVRKPLYYTRKHWIDLLVVLLPLIAFVRALRIAQLLRVNQLAKTARIYRLRGLAIRMWRGFVALDVIDALVNRDPQRKLEKLEDELEEKRHELAYLRLQIIKTKRRLEEKLAKEEGESKGEGEAVSQKKNKDVIQPTLSGESRAEGSERGVFK